MSLFRNVDAKVIIGAGYGDEGKGRMIEYFADKKDKALYEEYKKKYPKYDASIPEFEEVLNIRFNSGAQAAHTVCKIATKRNGSELEKTYIEHVFRQLGSGTFSNAITFLSEYFTVNVEMLKDELDILNEYYNNGYISTQPLVYIDKEACISLPIDISINRKLEELRGDNKHGSCGLGVWESQLRQRVGLGVKIKDLLAGGKYFDTNLKNASCSLVELQKEYFNKRVEELSEEFSNLKNEKLFDDASELFNKTYNLLNALLDLKDDTSVEFVDFEDTQLGNASLYLFEGAQGLELSTSTKENYPNISTSDTGVSNAIALIKKFYEVHKVRMDVEVVYLTRAYKTRHGAGKLPYENLGDSIKKDFNLYDRTNNENEFQGKLRYAPLNLDRLRELICRENNILNRELGAFYKTSLAIGHLDQTHGSLLVGTGTGQCELVDIAEILETDMVDLSVINTTIYTSYGPTSDMIYTYDIK